MAKRLLITGGAGFVGSSLAVSFKRERPDTAVIAFDNLKRRGSELTLKRLAEGGVEFVHGDVRNPDDLDAVGPVDWLIECSAEPSVHAGYATSPAYLLDTNLTGAVNCMEHLRRHGGGMVFLSTSRVYPIAALSALPLSETETRFEIPHGETGSGWSRNGINADFPLNGTRSLYGTTKLAAELLLAEYSEMYGIRAVVNRCGVLAGPWQMGKVDQGFIVLWMARHLFGGTLKYLGYGGTGKQVRDVLHVNDLYRLVDFQMANVETFDGKVFNVGGGVERSVSLGELSDKCRKVTGSAIEIGSDPATRPADIPYYVTCNSPITAASGWQPETGIDALLDDVHRWLVDNRRDLEPVLAP